MKNLKLNLIKNLILKRSIQCFFPLFLSIILSHYRDNFFDYLGYFSHPRFSRLTVISFASLKKSQFSTDRRLLTP